MELIIVSVISYLLGSFPFSYFVGKAYGKNLYKIGSGNVGAANVFRATQKIEALLLALLGDIGKGALSIFLVQKLNILGDNALNAQFLAAFFVVLGHNWPIFLRFKGGKGLASLAGVMIALNWKSIILALGAIIFFILLTDLIMKKKIDLRGSSQEKGKKLLSVLMSQIIGRDIGIAMAAGAIFFFHPYVFRVIWGAVILVALKHIRRTKGYLKKQKNKPI